MKRLVSLDILRGLSIVGVIFFHAFIFNVDMPPGFIDPSGISQVILYFLTWAGFFGMISATANTIALYGRFRKGSFTAKRMLLNFITTGLVVILINYIYMLVFAPGYIDPNYVAISILPAFIRTGLYYPPDPARILFATALLMVGTGILFTGLILYPLCRKDGYKKITRNCIVLGIIATAIIFVYPVLDTITAEYFTQPLTFANFVPRLFLSWIVGDMNPMFPYLGFMLYGAIFGILIVEGVRHRTILTYGYALGVTLTLIGMSYIATYGFDVGAYQTPPIGPLISILGPMLLSLTFCLHAMDFRKDSTRIWWIKHSVGSRSFGILTLTAFLLEGSFSQILGLIVGLFYPAWWSNVAFVFLIFSALILVLWRIILRYWAKIHFKGSFEWFIISAVAKFTGKKSTRLDVDHILHGYEEYVETKSDPSR